MIRIFQTFLCEHFFQIILRVLKDSYSFKMFSKETTEEELMKLSKLAGKTAISRGQELGATKISSLKDSVRETMNADGTKTIELKLPREASLNLTMLKGEETQYCSFQNDSPVCFFSLLFISKT